ncbi:MAG: DUF4386 domain-containing protein [Arenimonas sp.]|nr:DUF4386 domain-containing protein [Arenimonas sp.]
MASHLKTGRIIGALLLLQVAVGILLNFVFTAPLFGEPGFLINAAPHATQIAQSVLLSIAMGLVSLTIACMLYPLFKTYSQPLAMFYFALVTAGFALTVAENISMMSMLSLSKAYAEYGATQESLYQGLRIVVKETRNWTHYLSLIVSGVTIFTFYLTTLRFKLIPRALSAFGLLACMSQLIAIAMPLFGQGVDFRLIAPLGICEIVLGLWLIAKGFKHAESPAS